MTLSFQYFKAAFIVFDGITTPAGHSYVSGLALVLKVTRYRRPKSPLWPILEVRQEGPAMVVSGHL